MARRAVDGLKAGPRANTFPRCILVFICLSALPFIVPCILKTKRPGVMSKSTQRSDPGILNSDRTVTVNEKALCHQRPIAVYAVCTFGGY
jgi:hypothetical protein